MIGNARVELQLSKMYWKKKNLFTNRLVLQKIILNYYYSLNFIYKNCGNLFSIYCVSTYLLYSIWPLSLQNLKYSLSGLLQKKFVNPC